QEHRDDPDKGHRFLRRGEGEASEDRRKVTVLGQHHQILRRASRALDAPGHAAKRGTGKLSSRPRSPDVGQALRVGNPAGPRRAALTAPPARADWASRAGKADWASRRRGCGPRAGLAMGSGGAPVLRAGPGRGRPRLVTAPDQEFSVGLSLSVAPGAGAGRGRAFPATALSVRPPLLTERAAAGARRSCGPCSAAWAESGQAGPGCLASPEGAHSWMAHPAVRSASGRGVPRRKARPAGSESSSGAGAAPR